MKQFIEKLSKIIKPNERQKTYLATLLAVAGGTVMHTAWSFYIPINSETPKVESWIISTLIGFSLLFIFVGYTVYVEDKQ